MAQREESGSTGLTSDAAESHEPGTLHLLGASPRLMAAADLATLAVDRTS